MARLVRNNSVDRSTGKTLSSILEANVVKTKRGTLTGYPCALINNMLHGLTQRKKKGVKVTDFKHFDVEDHVEFMAQMKPSEVGSSVGYGTDVNKALKKFHVSVDPNHFVFAAVMDVAVKFKAKATEASATKHKIGKFKTFVHTKMLQKHSTEDVYRIPTEDGSIIVYMPKSQKEITHAYRKALVASKKFKRTANTELCIPHVDFDYTNNLKKFVSVKATDAAGDVLECSDYTLTTRFEMDAVGAKVKQVATMRLTKGIAPKIKVVKMDKPFIVIVERGNQEIFAAAINKKDWVRA